MKSKILILALLTVGLALPRGGFAQGRTTSRQTWPFQDEHLVYAWSAGMGSTRMLGSVTKSKVRAVRRGRMKFDSNGRMNVTGGSLLIAGAARPLVEAAKKTGELTIETLIATPNLTQVGPARIITFSMDGYSRNFTLGQERDELLFRLRTPRTGINGIDPQSVLTKLLAGKPQHVIVTYRSGEIVAFLNGEQVYKSDKITGDFSNWDGKHQLVIGEEYKGGRGWNGIVDRVASFNRFMENDEAVARYRHLYGGPPPKPRTVASTKPSPTTPKPMPTRPATVPSISTPASKPIPLPPRIPKPSTKPASFVTFSARTATTATRETRPKAVSILQSCRRRLRAREVSKPGLEFTTAWPRTKCRQRTPISPRRNPATRSPAGWLPSWRITTSRIARLC